MNEKPLYYIIGSTLTIPDSEDFGFDGCALENEEFCIVEDSYVRNRRSYSIHRLVIEQKSTGRFFAREYSSHEDCGFEWGPGHGTGWSTNWDEVFTVQVTHTIYK